MKSATAPDRPTLQGRLLRCPLKTGPYALMMPVMGLISAQRGRSETRQSGPRTAPSQATATRTHVTAESAERM
jgi:hypothetical protein